MRVLVTGGAGNIGSHTCLELLAAGYEAVLDNPSDARRWQSNRPDGSREQESELRSQKIRKSQRPVHFSASASAFSRGGTKP